MAPFLTSPSLVERVRGVLDVLGPSDYDVVLHNVQTPAQRDEQFAALAHRGRADGLLAISLAPDDLQVERFQRAGVPVVLVDAVHPELPHIVIDDVEGGRLAAEHLLKLGHRRVAFVGDEPEDAFGFTSSMQRREGFRAALEAAGCELPEVLVREAQHGRENANRVTEELVMLAEAPTAIFAASDTQALGVLEALQRTGRSVPGDVSVIGFDDIDVAAYVGLTTVRQPLYRSGEHGARVLLDAISGAVQDPDERLTLELVERRTTGLKA